MSMRLRQDAGSAVVEFCFLSVLMLVPLVYLVAVLGRVQAAALAAETAAREAGRAFVTAPDVESAGSRAESAAAIAFGDQGFSDQGTGTVELTCAADPCLVPDARVEVRTRVLVLLPGVPRVLDRVVPTRIEVTARQVVTVDRFRAAADAMLAGEEGR
jgi:Flp pilus assembly protein TadG